MHRLLIAAALLGLVQTAQAADMPELPALRGSFPEGLSSTQTIWQGLYIGGQYGYGSANMNFKGANDNLALGLQPQTGLAPTAYPALGKANQQGSAYGGFVGYNWQWEDVVIGLDASYLHGDYTGRSTGTNLLITPTLFTTSTASATVHDFGSLRVRAGYSIGSFLPYLTGGIGFGRADIIQRVSLANGTTGLSMPNATSLGDHFVYGYSAGFGVDVMLAAGFFLRGEYEYQRITSPVDINMNTVRGGLGYKF